MKIDLRPRKFNHNQVTRLASITADLGIVLIASVVLPALLGKIDLLYIISGTIFASLFFTISLRLEKVTF